MKTTVRKGFAKALALFLVLSMATSMCAFASNTTVTGISLDSDSETVIIGKDVTLEATLEPAGSEAKITWTTSDKAVATVADGVVTAKKAGTATITAKAGDQTATCEVTVTDTVTDAELKKSSDAVLNVPYGLSSPSSLMKDIQLVLTYGAHGTKEVTATWSSNKTFDGKKLGSTYTYTAKVSGVDYDSMPTVTVTVVPAVVSKITFDPADPMRVPLGTSEKIVEEALPVDAEVELQDGRKLTWSIGNGKNDELKAWDGFYDEDENDPDEFEYSTELYSDLSDNYIISSSVSLDYTVKTLDVFSKEDLNLTLKYNGQDDCDLTALIIDTLEEKYEDFNVNIDSKDVIVEEDSFTYGEVDKNGDYNFDLSSSNIKALEKGTKLTEKKIGYVAYDKNDVKYSGDLNITIISAVKNFTYTMEDDEFYFDFGGWITDKLEEAMTEDLISAVFSIEEDKGGTLYADEDLTEFEDEEEYFLKDEEDEYGLEDLWFIPDGTEADFEIAYIAYGEDEEELEGTITIECQEFLMMSADIDSTDTLSFSASDFEDLIDDSDYDDYTLEYIYDLKVSGGGNLYYDYDEDDKSHTKVSSSTKYYVDDDESKIIDDITYVPSKTTDGQVIITFTAYVEKGNKDEDLPATFVINVTEKADITIEVAKNGEVALDLDLFEDFLDENGGSKKNYEITYIVFEDAPASTSKGYLYDDGTKIKQPDGEKFYTEDSDDGDRPFDELTFKGGNSSTKTSGSFAIYGKKNSTSSNTKLVEGTIDFVVGGTSSTAVEGTIKASEFLSFSGDNLTHFEEMGKQDNVYVTFTSQPLFGKLYYNYGLSTQTDVKIGAEYYLTSASNKNLLKNVTYVPSYSSSKIAQTDVINVKAYNSKDKAVSGTIKISVLHAYASAYFTDITSSTYADSVDFLYNRRITTGMTSTTFGPSLNVTRGQFVTFLYRAAGSPTLTSAYNNSFTDVKNTDYYYNAVRWAVKEGITTGRSATIFDPNANVTYQEIMTFLYRYDVKYLGHVGALGSSSYVYDYAKVDTWAQTPVLWAVQKGVLSAGYLNPTTAGTRADVALYLHRMLSL